MRPGEKLRTWRRSRGLSQAALGAALDPPISQSAIDRYERGRVPEPAIVLGLFILSAGAVDPNSFHPLPALAELVDRLPPIAPPPPAQFNLLEDYVDEGIAA